MIEQHKKNAAIGVPIGLIILALAGCFAVHASPVAFIVFLAIFGFILYTWGCVELAKGKGYSTAIVLTVVLGIFPPAVVLLSLEDKNKRRRRR